MLQRDLKKLSLLAEVACDYYERGLSQDEIASRLHLSRTRVSRLIKEAREKGIVSITINYSFERHFELEERLKSRFQLKDARVLNNRGRNKATIQFDVGKLAANLLMEKAAKGMILGTSWGAALADCVSQLQSCPVPCEIVQLVGSIPSDTPNSTPQAIVSTLADAFGGQANYLNLPLYIEDEYVRNAMCQDRNNATILNKALFCDIALTGLMDVSSVDDDKCWFIYMTPEMQAEILEKGAVGFIWGQFYDVNGKRVNCAWNRNCIAIAFETLKGIRDAVAVVSSAQKSQAILSALKGRLFNILITDGTTATKLLNFYDQSIAARK